MRCIVKNALAMFAVAVSRLIAPTLFMYRERTTPCNLYHGTIDRRVGTSKEPAKRLKIVYLF